MSIKCVLFDLDGTLLPMDQDVFTKSYFGLLAKKLIPFGYDGEKLVSAIGMGIKSMVKNDGTFTNKEVFWKIFAGILGEKVYEDMPLFDAFYRNEFKGVKEVCGYTAKAAEVVQAVKDKGLRVGLATNPLFPKEATAQRIEWAELAPEDFEFYTTYDNSCHCKPNLDYYRDILKLLSLEPNECLMVGNDVAEDMITRELGMSVFLLTDCLINRKSNDISVYPHGNFDDLLAFIQEL